MLRTVQTCALLLALTSPPSGGVAVVPLVLRTQDRLALSHEQFLDSRRLVLANRDDPFHGPSLAQIIEEYPSPWKAISHAWHHQVNATVFWVGELATQNNPVSNVASSWDPNWAESFGGLDHPTHRSGYLPADFVPNQNPFYFALPYNDLDSTGGHRPEASSVIPWFWRAYQGPSISVCRDRWVAIHREDRVCFAQWKDVGPFSVDDWEYVFGNKPPRPNRNSDAGIDVSPAVRDFLGLRGTDRVSWRFVEDGEVPPGPWLGWTPDQLASEPLPAR